MKRDRSSYWRDRARRRRRDPDQVIKLRAWCRASWRRRQAKASA